MKNMSVPNGTSGVISLEDLDLIDEYIEEDKARGSSQGPLPGPPPPPSDPEMQPHASVVKPRPTPPRLVSRGTAQVPRGITSMHPSRGSKGCTPRRGRAAAAGPYHQQTGTEPLERFLDKPDLVVVEQPKERGMRFRYECEGRSAGSILGTTSTDVNKTMPAIELRGPLKDIKKGTITVSLVTKDFPHRPHPHCLVGKDCADGICVVHMNLRANSKHSFANLGIQCIRRKELDTSLQKRRDQNIDPFNTGHSKSIEDMDMNVVRLCFQCELEREDGESIQLAPVLSNPIYDKKATTTSELKISRLNLIRGPCTGKTEIYMLCDKVQKDDIEIIFSLGSWEAKAEFAQTDVHRQIAIVFKTPPFREQDITEEVEVNVSLRRQSDRMDSEPVKFIYLPDNTDPYGVDRKRKIRQTKFNDRSCYTAEPDMMGEPMAPKQFDPYAYDLPESSVPMATSSQEDMQSVAARSMEEIHYPTEEDDKQEDICPSMDPDLLQSLFATITQALQPNLLNQEYGNTAFLMGEPDSNSNFALDGTGMNVSFFNDIQFCQMVAGNQGLVSEADPPGSMPEDLEGLTLTQVKTEDEEEF